MDILPLCPQEYNDHQLTVKLTLNDHLEMFRTADWDQIAYLISIRIESYVQIIFL